jgi:GPR180/TMEM145, transmembrane domain
MYSDREKDWFSVYNSDDECQERLDKANAFVIVSDEGDAFLFNVTIKNARPRWWWFVVTNCDDFSKPIDIEWDIAMVNSDGAKYMWHFGANEQGVFEMSVFFLVATSVAILVAAYTIYHLISNKMRVHIFLPFALSMLLEWIGNLVMVVHYELYSRDGIGYSGAETGAQFLTILAELCILAAVLVIVRGYPISTSYLPGRRFLVLILCLFVFTYIALFIVGHVVMDPALK